MALLPMQASLPVFHNVDVVQPNNDQEIADGDPETRIHLNHRQQLPQS
jgi:hypothetical protein